MTPVRTLPMFPLGSVLFPTMVLPLHVFEDRYRRLVTDCLAGEREFGVCLIERGHEVGGGDARTTVGTVAQIVDAHEFDDGRWAIAAVGTRRIRIVEWLDDDPYPCADVDDWLDAAPTGDLSEQRDETVGRLRQILALQSELGQAAPAATTELDEDPTLASYQAAALSPTGPFDRQRLLGAETVDERYDLLDGLLADIEHDLRRQLDLG